MSSAPIEDLILRHFEGGLTESEQTELAKALSESNEARELFASYMRLEGATLQLGIGQAISSDESSAIHLSSEPSFEGPATEDSSAPNIKSSMPFPLVASFLAGALARKLRNGNAALAEILIQG